MSSVRVGLWFKVVGRKLGSFVRVFCREEDCWASCVWTMGRLERKVGV